MMGDLLTWGLVGLTGYTGLPTLWMRLGFSGTLRRSFGSGRKVALTFDDGPDPRYTSRILEVLAKYDVPACFFMLGNQAERHPDLVRQVVAAGHEVGVHGYRHILQSILGRRSTGKEIERTAHILSEITGERPRFFRPPWGVFNLWTAQLAKRLGLTPVVWSAHANDWVSGPPERLLGRIMARLHPCTVLLLHDGTGPGADADAPEHLLAALPGMIEWMRRAGYHLVPLCQVTDLHKEGEPHVTPV